MKKETKTIIEAIKEKNIRGFLTMLNVLKKEDIESVDEQTGFNVIHCCAQENASKELLLIVNHIKDIDLNLKSRGIVQRSALDIAFTMSNKEVSKVLIKNGAFFSSSKQAKKTFKNDYKFSEIVDEALEKIEKTMPERKKKSFFSFTF